MKPYEWMTTYTPQQEWIEKRGIFMPLAFFFGSLGGGLYLVSLYFNSLWGISIAWLIVAALKGGSHLIDLGQPFRSWRMVFRPQSSWISRGLILVILFLGLVPIQVYLTVFFPGTGLEALFKVLAGMAALGTCMYPGFTLNFINAIPFWNSAMLPILFLSLGSLGGFGLLMVIGVIGGEMDLARVGSGNMILILVTAILITVFAWSASYVGPSGKRALRGLLKGEVSVAFWVGVVLIGIVMPWVVTFLVYTGVAVPGLILFLGALGDIICGFALTYVILKSGAYSPLIPMTGYEEE
jgi:formate-dependent nitrite reductase membrane component NrfD